MEMGIDSDKTRELAGHEEGAHGATVRIEKFTHGPEQPIGEEGQDRRDRLEEVRRVAKLKIELMQASGKSGAATPQTAVERPSDASESLQFISFSEAENLLAKCNTDLSPECKINLAKEVSKHVRRLVRWGVIQKENAAALEDTFKKTRFSRRDIQHIFESKEAAPNSEWIFLFPLDISEQELFQKLIIDAGIPYNQSQPFSSYREVDPYTCEPLQGKGTAAKSDVMMIPAGANFSLVFDVGCSDRSVNDEFAQVDGQSGWEQGGWELCGPGVWAQLFRIKLDQLIQRLAKEINIREIPSEYVSLDQYRDLVSRVLNAVLKAAVERREVQELHRYMLDTGTITQFPQWRDPRGNVLRLNWENDPGHGVFGVHVGSWSPTSKSPNVGVRRYLGGGV